MIYRKFRLGDEVEIPYTREYLADVTSQESELIGWLPAVVISVLEGKVAIKKHLVLPSWNLPPWRIFAEDDIDKDFQSSFTNHSEYLGWFCPEGILRGHSKSKVKDGEFCLGCGCFSMMAEANHKEGFVCWSCRDNPVRFDPFKSGMLLRKG